MARKTPRRKAANKNSYANVAAAIAVIAVLIISIYYYMSVNNQPVPTTTAFPSTTALASQFGANASSQWIDISPNHAYVLNTSYMANSTVDYYQIQATQYTSPLWYGPGMKTAYDSMIGNPQFESRVFNGLSIDSIAAQYPDNVLEMWAYTEPFNTAENASNMFDFMYQWHIYNGQSVPSSIEPGIGNRSILLTYNSIPGQFEVMNLYMVLFVYNDTFVQIGGWAPRNSTANQTIEIARAYERNMVQMLNSTR
ncbi:MAG: hypothetical protein KGH69_04825 [Candidatus Micrarchaeota archaeon]|nr:hypothetical protein [Candidatus Micrarchaeota archaeon]